jgi:hypothetical protein
MFDLDAQVRAYHNAHPFAALTTFPTDPSEITTEFY